MTHHRPLPILCTSVALLVAGGAHAEPQQYRIDPEHLSIGFSASHIGYAAVLGLFTKGEGSFTYDPVTRTLSEAAATVDASSVFTAHAKRDDHLRSGDFLAAGEHPDISFTMTSAERTDEGSGLVTGDLTLRGVTRPVVLEVKLNAAKPSPIDNSDRLGISIRTVIKRSEWGSTYAVANGWVGDEIPITIELEAVHQPSVSD